MPSNENYQTFTHIFKNRGLIARYATDRPPDPNFYWDLTNVESRQENALATRFGLQPLTAVGGVDEPLSLGSAQTLARMLSTLGNSYRYAGAQGGLYRMAGTGPGQYTQIFTGLSGKTFSWTVDANIYSGQAWIYIADAGTGGVSAMLKDNGGGAAPELWGLDPPQIPAITALASPGFEVIDDFSSPITDYTVSTIASLAASSWATGTTSSGANAGSPTEEVVPIPLVVGSQSFWPFALAKIGSLTDQFVQGQSSLTLYAAIASNILSGAAVSQAALLSGTLTAGQSGYVKRSVTLDLSAYANSGSIVLNCIAGSVASVKVDIDVYDGSFAVGYYSYTANLPGAAPIVNDTNLQGPGVDWRIVIPLSGFTAVGAAGSGGASWGTVKAWRITFTAEPSLNAAVGLVTLFAINGNGPNSIGGNAYSYAYTYYNAMTGAESNPSPLQVQANALYPLGQQVVVTANNPTDTQITHIRFYRLGGTLARYNLVAQLPVITHGSGTLDFLDNVTDSGADVGQAMSAPSTMDPPISSPLPNPVDTTLDGPTTPNSTQTVNCFTGPDFAVGQLAFIDSGSNFETVIIQGFTTGGTGTITAYFQLAHQSGARVFALTKPRTGMNLCASAFGMKWLAGDPNNPHALYFSLPNQPEAFPSGNYIFVGTPDAPITGLIWFRGQLLVATTQTWYQVLVEPGAIPQALPTGTIHGLITPFAWAATESAIYYRSDDGIYAFTGGGSVYTSEAVMWLFTDSYQGALAPIDETQIASERLVFFNNEVYHLYTAVGGGPRRVIRDLIYQRFRADDLELTAMLWERDTRQLVVASYTSGMIYFDRINDFDGFGYSGGILTETPINFSVQTQSLDFGFPKQDKVWNELTLDIDTKGQPISVSLILDELQETINLPGTFSTSGRHRLNIGLNNGLGYQSRALSLRLYGAVTSAVEIYEFFIRGVLLAEPRQTWDTYKLDFDMPGYKFAKQGWFEYNSSSLINVYVYLDDNPNYTFYFQLPASTTVPGSIGRSAVRVRFPAFKARVWRFTGVTFSSDFRMYSTSFIEWKSVNSIGGYKASRLREPV